MKLHVCSVYDSAVGAFLQPFYARSKGEAIRSFVTACGDEKMPFKAHAADYVLMHLGVFDDNSGGFVCQDPVRVLSALEAVQLLANPEAVETPWSRAPGNSAAQ